MPMQPRVRHMRRLRWHTRRFERTRDCGGLPRHSAAPRAECSSVPGPPLPCPLRPPSRVCVRACVGFSFLSPVPRGYISFGSCCLFRQQTHLFSSKRCAVSFFAAEAIVPRHQELTRIQTSRVSTASFSSTGAFPPQARRHPSLTATTRRARLVAGKLPC